MGKLHVCAANDAYLFHNTIGLILQTLLHLFRNRQHRCGTERVTCMHTQRINIFNKANGNHVALSITDNFQLQFFPAQNRFFHQDLPHKAGLQTTGAHCLEFIHIIHKAAASTTHGIGRTQNDRISQLIGNGKSLFHRCGNFTAGHFDAQFLHGLLKFHAILATLDSIHLYPNDLHIVFFQHAGLSQLRAQVETRLTAQIGKKSVRALFFNDLGKTLYIQRLNIGHVSRFRVGHDRGRIGVYQHYFIPKILQGLARLCSRIIEFTGLADNDGAGTNNQYFVNIVSLHTFSSQSFLFACSPEQMAQALISRKKEYLYLPEGSKKERRKFRLSLSSPGRFSPHFF